MSDEDQKEPLAEKGTEGEPVEEKQDEVKIITGDEPQIHNPNAKIYINESDSIQIATDSKDVTVLHAEDIDRFVEHFDMSVEDLIEVISDIQTVDPKALVGAIIDRKTQELSLDIDQREAITAVAEAALTIDEGTGFYDRKIRPLIESVGDILAQTSDLDVMKVQIDISNMGTANNAIGRDAVDDAVDLMAAIYTKNLIEHGADEVIHSRDGGDELGFLVVGLSEEETKIAMLASRAEVDEVMHDAGLDVLIHAKYPEDLERAGFSVGGGAVALGEGRSSGNIQGIIDAETELDKPEGGALRVTRHAEDRKAGDVGNSRYHAEDFHHSEGVDDKDAGRRFLNLQSAKNVISDAKDKFVEAGFVPEKIEDKWPEETIPTKALQDIDPLRNAEEVRTFAAELKAEELGMNADQRDLLVSVVEFYDERDPLTNMKGARDFVDDIKRLQGAGEEVFLANIEVENLSGLNKAVGHHGADTAIEHVAQIVQEELALSFGDAITDNLYHKGGGQFGLISPAELVKVDEYTQDELSLEFKQEKLQEVLAGAADKFAIELQGATANNYIGRLMPEEHQAEFAELIASITPQQKQEEFVELLDEAQAEEGRAEQLLLQIPHPRREDVHGTGLEYITLKLENEQMMSVEQHLDLLDVLKEYEGNEGLSHDEVIARRKDNVDRREIDATWTIGARGGTGEIERSVEGESRRAEEGEELTAREERRDRPRVGSYSSDYLSEMESPYADKGNGRSS